MVLYKIENIAKDFRIGSVTVPALRGLSLQINKGEFVALRGPSGSGKSTLLNVLGLLEQPSAGRIFFDGRSLEGASEHDLTLIRRSSVGFIFQSYNLVPILSAQENVEYPLQLTQEYTASEIRARALKMLEEVGIGGFAKHRPAELSGGQRQRVAIARALVKHPQVILADEPTANLDSKTASQIMELIRKLKEKSGTTVILATHDTNIAAMAERSIFIRDGQVVDSP